MSTDFAEEPDVSVKRQFTSTRLDEATASNRSTSLIIAADCTETRF
jgi:hypothetical protein